MNSTCRPQKGWSANTGHTTVGLPDRRDAPKVPTLTNPQRSHLIKWPKTRKRQQQKTAHYLPSVVNNCAALGEKPRVAAAANYLPLGFKIHTLTHSAPSGSQASTIMLVECLWSSFFMAAMSPVDQPVETTALRSEHTKSCLKPAVVRTFG